MSLMPPFTPGPTVTGSSNNASTAAIALGAPVGQDKQVLVTSPAGGALGFIVFGDSAVADASASNGTPILPGTAQIFTLGAAATHFKFFAATTTAVYCTTGSGE